ncbi:unnamed protein product, partial [Candidula unifasciata]
IMPSDRTSDRVCPKSESDSCPSGHMLTPCLPSSTTEYFCKQCSEATFQPNENWITDKCRLRRNCRKPHMDFADVGSTVRDATCVCDEGFHFPNEDQRACVPNKRCPLGTAPGVYGNCESCLRKSMYLNEKTKKCVPLTNCEKQNRCTRTKSDGMRDNVCGPVVSDLSTCEDINITVSSSSTKYTIAIVGSIVAAVLLLLIILLIFIFCLRRRRLRNQVSQKALTDEEMEELQQKILKACDKDVVSCKKVMSISCSFIEERIDRQIWGLAQELFRTSTKQGHFEQIVEKYKDTQAKYTVNGYLQEWRQWRGDNKETAAELFHCLRHIKREDIVNEICLCLGRDFDYTDGNCYNEYSSNKLSLKDECVYIFLPCFYRSKEKLSPSAAGGVVVESDVGEAGTKLLAIATDDLDQDDSPDNNTVGSRPPGTFYRAHPSPSAPTLEDANNIFASMDNVKFSRQFSQPVQATS